MFAILGKLTKTSEKDLNCNNYWIKMVDSVYEGMTNSEKEVSEYLQRIDIWWLYEQPVFVMDEKNRPRVWTPDFYLPELGLYIEVCGSETFDYKYREEIYKKNKVPVVFIHRYKNKDSWQKFLRQRIREIHEKRWEIIKKI